MKASVLLVLALMAHLRDHALPHLRLQAAPALVDVARFIVAASRA